MREATSTPGSAGPVWTAAAVARRLGVAPGTLRSWSRRYGIGPAAHEPGRHRRYTVADLTEIDAMRALVAQGMTLPAAAAIIHSQRRPAHTDGRVASQVRPAVPDQTQPPPAAGTDSVTDLAGTAARLDLDRATAVITASLTEHGVIPTWNLLCRPAFADLETAVAHDLGCTDAQLLLSSAVTTCLRRIPGTPAHPGTRPALLACAAEEHHTLPLETLLAALTERDTPATMLGPAVPDAALLHAARQLRPTTVLVWSHRAATATPALLSELLTHADTVVAAGPGWHDIDLPPGVLTADDLLVALALTAHPGTDPCRLRPGWVR